MGHDFRGSDHLPKRRPDGEPADPEGLPRQRRGTTPQMHGRYPDFDVLGQAEHWDEVTRRVVLARVEERAEPRFFTPAEAVTVAAFADMVTAQDREPRVPLEAMIDAKLYEGRLDGYQYADMPDDRSAWRLIARGLDEAALERGASSFAAAAPALRFALTKAFADGELAGGVWDEVPVGRGWTLATRDILEAFYSHPWAWNEIGFGGPAYPRGYMSLGIDQREPWEAEEVFSIDPVVDVAERGLQ